MERVKIDKSIYNHLPIELKKVTENFEGREKDIALISSIGVISSCLPNLFGLYNGDKIYPNIYTIIIAPPASGKGTMNYSRHLVQKIHEKILEMSKQNRDTVKNSNSEKKVNESLPEIEIKILPANISTAEMYSFLGVSKHGLIIFESEADTLGQMLKNDWSNYSDVLRKAFHHENLSISRKMEKIFEEIKEPKLSMVISGTPDQLKPIIQSRENGLFSRFIIYNFDEITEFKNVFAKKNFENIERFKTLGYELFNFYGVLQD